ncbi:MAG TPA: ribokinase [Terracidiphilus sp.]|jgi:ribokinase|nr:ribokinase [Terracidiphilus sp.]
MLQAQRLTELMPTPAGESMDKPIVVVGSVNLDLVCAGKRIPAPGETVSGEIFQTFFGGKGANQAVAVGRLGYPVSMIAKVGDDEFGSQLRNGLRAAKVNVREVGTTKDTASGVALISVDAKGQNSIMVIPGANGKLLPRDIDRALPMLRSAGMILTQLEIPMETVEYLCEVSQRLKVPLMLDPAPARQLSRKIFKQVSFLTPNESETCMLCGISTSALTPAMISEAAQQLRSKGPANVIIKLGARGAYIDAADGLRCAVSSFKVGVVDSTAAGDAFNAGLAVALLRGMSLRDATRYAAAAGAVSVTRAGAQPAMPTGPEVEKLLASRAPGKAELSGGRR